MHCDEAPVSELELAQEARIKELKAELELERRLRCKLESANKVLAKELAEERRAREAAEGRRRRLEEELASKREEVERVAREMEEERRMLQIAELWREERVQIKLLEAKLVMEEKLQEMMVVASQGKQEVPINKEEEEEEEEQQQQQLGVLKVTTAASGDRQIRGGHEGQQIRREVENPHIRRGIKGFVEFPKVVRTHKGRAPLAESNLECQRAQLRILMRHRHRNPPGLMTMGTSLDFVTSS